MSTPSPASTPTKTAQPTWPPRSADIGESRTPRTTIRDVTFTEDASTGTEPRVMATLGNLAIGALKTLGADSIAKTTRVIRDEPERALPILGITNTRTSTELDQALTC